MNTNPVRPTRVSRRNVLVGSGATALGLAGLAACGSDTDEGSAAPADEATTPSETSDAPSPSPDESPDGSPGEPPAGALVALSEVPVGGGVSAEGKDGEPLIVSQPTEGNAVAFSAICTHRGCTVAPQGDILECPCHGSTYNITTGDNTGGPAPRPLDEVQVTVTDGYVTQA